MPPPSTLCSPQLQSTCHYIVNHYVKILHVHLGVANNMRPLSCGGGGGHKRKRSNLLIKNMIKYLTLDVMCWFHRDAPEWHGTQWHSPYEGDSTQVSTHLRKTQHKPNFPLVGVLERNKHKHFWKKNGSFPFVPPPPQLSGCISLVGAYYLHPSIARAIF